MKTIKLENKNLKRLHNEAKIALTKEIVRMRNFNLNTEKNSDYQNEFNAEFNPTNVEINGQIAALIGESPTRMKQEEEEEEIKKEEWIEFVQLLMRLSSFLDNHFSFYRNPIAS